MQVSSILYQAWVTTNQVSIDSWLNGQRPARPCQQSVPLSHHPIHRTIEVHNGEGSRRRAGGNKRSDRARRRNLRKGQLTLVQ